MFHYPFRCSIIVRTAFIQDIADLEMCYQDLYRSGLMLYQNLPASELLAIIDSQHTIKSKHNGLLDALKISTIVFSR